MKQQPALIYQGINHTIPGAIIRELSRSLERGRKKQARVFLYFRADDGGVPGRNWARLARLFLAHGMPLNVALVPAWLTRKRWDAMGSDALKAGTLFCWHQHGWRHTNHEPRGKKQEFGPCRRVPDIQKDLTMGRQRLEDLMGNHFYPVFTPPWNRCSPQTIDLLRINGYKALSRDAAPPSQSDPGIREFPVHLDLHTRKDVTIARGWDSVFASLTKGLETGCCGIMIHHMRMNDPAFVFLEGLIKEIETRKWITPVTFDSLISHGF